MEAVAGFVLAWSLIGGWILMAWALGKYAETKGRSKRNWMLVAGLISPGLSMIYLWMAKDDKEPQLPEGPMF